MCYFITICVSELHTEIFQKKLPQGLYAWRCENKYLMEHLAPEYQGYVLTSGMCSCDLYRSPPRETVGKKIQRLVKKYQTKGWSECKVSRAINDSIKSVDPGFVGLRLDVRKIIGSMAYSANGVFVYVRMYSGNQTTEKINVNKGAEISSGEFNGDDYFLEEETLVKINR